MTEGAARPCRRSKRDGELRVDGDDGLPGVFDAREPAAGLALDLAEPREVAAQEGDDRGDGEVRLDQRPAAAKLGFTSVRITRTGFRAVTACRLPLTNPWDTQQTKDRQHTASMGEVVLLPSKNVAGKQRVEHDGAGAGTFIREHAIERQPGVDGKHETWEICLTPVQVQNSPSGMLACQLI
uniref:DUF834 domain-containing protein n=1 Tax=Oryza sativa subsp. japonica TaxID=39947 RepID=Q6UUI0_ORYSJ|nr:hypothetical protein OSJNBa0003M24.12 [Oryza sativa Japonica Group]